MQIRFGHSYSPFSARVNPTPYAVDPQITRDEALDYWTKQGKTAFLARLDENAVGTYYIRPN